MSKNVFYRYNPETDNFERVYPSLRMRLAAWGKTWIIAALIGTVLFLVVFYFFDSPTEEHLRKENSQLRTQYGILSRRLDNSLKVMERLQDRDDNFYRVMMQMDPVSRSQRLAGLDNESRYRELEQLSDAALVTRLAQRMDLLERQLFAQVQSFDQLRDTLGQQTEKLARIPSVLPIKMGAFTVSSGFGFRRDPINGSTIFHEGLDLAAPVGTPVFATANGVVAIANRQAGFGNCIELDHGFNYLSRYAHLSEILVEEGDRIERGQLIGRVGSTGKSSGPHLHYEVRFRGEPQNPVNYCFMDLTPEKYTEMIQIAENAGYVMD